MTKIISSIMKLLMTSLALLLMPISVLADNTPGFSATDKVLYFNSYVLIDVIKSTFPEGLRLSIAQKYVNLMDEKGNVSVADLTTVCEAGNLDVQECRNFIQDLLNTSENKDIKPFYWADYIGKGQVLLGIRNSGDGYFNDSKSVDLGGWGVQFDWTGGLNDSSAFKRVYPSSNAIIGTSACTGDAGTPYMPDNTKNYAPNTQTGEHCWCKMTAPEESPWVYLLNQTSTNAQSTCARVCSAHCLNAMYGNTTFYSTNLQKATFTSVKISGSNANAVIDNTLAGNLTNEFKPREFAAASIFPLKYVGARLDSNRYECKVGCCAVDELCTDLGKAALFVNGGGCYVDEPDFGCAKGTKVCVLGQSWTEDMALVSLNNGCWYDHNGSWEKYDGGHTWCSGGIWSKAKPSVGGSGRTLVFINNKNQYLADNTGKPMKSVVYNSVDKPDVKCIAHICIKGNKASVGCPDGSCREKCTEEPAH